MKKVVNLNITVRYTSNSRGDPDFLETQSGNLLKGLINDNVSQKIRDLYNIQIEDITVIDNETKI